MENLIYNELRTRGLMVDVGVVVINIKDKEGKSQRKQLKLILYVTRAVNDVTYNQP